MLRSQKKKKKDKYRWDWLQSGSHIRRRKSSNSISQDITRRSIIRTRLDYFTAKMHALGG